MPKDQTKLLKVVVSKVEIGTTATPGVEPGAYTDVGLIHDEKVTVKAEPISDREITGSEYQKALDVSLETSAMQVKDIATFEGFKNATCWMKVTDVSGSVYKIKDFVLNIGTDMQLYSKGKSAVIVTGKRYATQVSDFWAIV